MQIFVDTKYDFVKWRFHAVVFSLIWVIIGAVMFAKHGINWGIDFAGGANIGLNFRGRESVADLLYQADPDRKGTNADAKKYYDGVAQNIISKRSELGLFRNMQQVVNVPGVTTGIAGVLNGRTFLGSFNVLNQEAVGPQVGRELQQKAVWAIVLS